MAISDVYPFETGEASDTDYVDTGMDETESAGAAPVDDDRPAIVETGIVTNDERPLAALGTVPHG